MSDKKILYYVNQFFGQIGGEEKADVAPSFVAEKVGPAAGFQTLVKDFAEVAGTIICGDNYYNEHEAEALEAILGYVREQKPDLVVAGPAFLAGRYGMACMGVCRAVQKELGIPAFTGMNVENPGVDLGRADVTIVETGNSAADMRKALPKYASLARKVLAGEKITPEADGYFAHGIRETIFSDKRGSERAVEMLLKRLADQPFKTELPMPQFDSVEPAAAIADLSKATIALVTSGGIVPKGNPDHLQSASAQQWNKYDISGEKDFKADFCTIHGGYDPTYANEDADRVLPVDVMREFEKEGLIGSLHNKYYATVGNGTAVASAKKFGEEIAKRLKADGVDAVILTST